jgi:hypothetical protein
MSRLLWAFSPRKTPIEALFGTPINTENAIVRKQHPEKFREAPQASER